MASNKFAAMLHRNTHKITVILVYTALEWTLIVLLLLNSLFSYLISKFALFFGLKPPCPWCSRLDHVLEPTKHANSYRDLICETHAAEISKLGYCSNHRKLAESGDMCEDCSSSWPCHSRSDGRIAFFSIVKDMGVISTEGASKIEKGGKDLRCSCCGVSLGGGLYSPYLVFKPSWGVLDYTQKGNLIKEKGEEDESCNGFIGGGFSDPSRSDCPTDHDEDEIRNGDGMAENQMLSDVSVDRGEGRMEEEEEDRLECPAPRFGFEETEGEDEIGSMESDQDHFEDDSKVSIEGTATLLRSPDENEILIRPCSQEDASSEICTTQLSSKFSDQDRLIPIELIDSMTLSERSLPSSGKNNEENEATLDMESHFKKHVASAVDMGEVSEEKEIPAEESEVNKNSEMLETVAENENSSVIPAEKSNIGLVDEVCNQVAIAQGTQTMVVNSDDHIPVVENGSDEYRGSEEGNDMINNEEKSERLMEGDICDDELNDRSHIHEQIPSLSSLDKDHSSDKLVADQVSEQAEDLTQKGGDCCLASQSVLATESTETIGQNTNHHLASCSEFNDAEEEKPPETPTFYMESLHILHKRLIFERKESGTESLDGSVISETDGGEVLTIDHLKSALRVQRKALNALYTELEEERSASAIAANQTMAMITRLQEEKAAMQMEALQYQRMMEEQSEYDQEALQLLNELMVKREKEKQELEKELELYRKKVLLVETKEKRMMRKEKSKRSNGTSSASSSAEDSDEPSIDLNEGDDVFFGMQEITQNTPVDDILAMEMGHESTKQLSTLDESLADFEEERLSILEQLKALEEKLFTMADEEHFEDIKSIEHYLGENGNEGCENCEFCNHHENGVVNGSSEEFSTNGIHYHERRNMGSKAKTLLPLFDAISLENEEALHEEQDPSLVSQNSLCKFTPENKKLAIEEEVEHVYGRLQALEADREFLKHCISSLKKGDKGMDLLQEILQHLRDLRNVELRVRNSGDTLS